MKRFLGTTALGMLIAGASIGFAQAQVAGCGMAPLDTDANGSIDADEQQAFDLGVYSGTDYNGDGIVSRDEHCFDPGTIEPAAGPVTTPEPVLETPIILPVDEAQFRTFDSDGDGKISREEWTGLTDRETDSTWGFEARFNELDEDSDNYLSMSEFMVNNPG